MFDRKALEKLAADVKRLLRDRDGITTRTSLKSYRTDTDGIGVTLAQMMEPDVYCEIWHDRWMIAGRWRQLYCGICSQTRYGREKVRKCAEEHSRVMKIPCYRLDDTCPTRVVRRGHRILSGRYGASYKGSLFFEDYESANITWFGKYTEHQPTEDAQSLDQCVEEIADHFAPLLDPTGEGRSASGEERRRSRHIEVEETRANRAAMRQRKVQDKFICAVCGLDPGWVYTKEYGTEIAEAHHLVPLKDLRSRRTITVDDLVTVCPNCHRALHRMSGERGDVRRLRRIVASRQRSRSASGMRKA